MGRAVSRILARCIGLAVAVFVNSTASAQTPPQLLQIWQNHNEDNGTTFQPGAIATDPATGNVFVTDLNNGRILKYDPLGRFIFKWNWVSPRYPNDQLGFPRGLYLDHVTGTLNIVDLTKNRVIQCDLDGNLIRQWGGFGSGPGDFYRPRAVDADALGNLYVSDQGNQRVQKFTRDGAYLGEWPVPVGSFSGTNPTLGLAVDATRSLVYVSVFNDYKVLQFDTGGNLLRSWGGTYGSGPGEFRWGMELAVDEASGHLLVNERDNARVQVFASDGTYLISWGTPGVGEGAFNQPVGIHVDSDGKVFVADTLNHRVQRFTQAGGFDLAWGNPKKPASDFNLPSGVAMDEQRGWVYVADTHFSRIQKFDLNGTYLTEWPAGGPYGLELDAAGDLYVADAGGNRIRKYDPDGNLLLQWGTKGSAPGQFDNPRDVAVHPVSGEVFVIDEFNHRVQRFTATGGYIGEWGGTKSTAPGLLSNPFGLAISPTNGLVYVADTNNARIQVYDVDGNYLFAWGEAGDNGPGLFQWPRTLDIYPNGDVLVAVTGLNQLQKFDAIGNHLLTIEGHDPAAGPIFHPRAVAVNKANGDIYVTASYLHKIHRLDAGGNHLTTWGYSSLSQPSELNTPTGITVDPTTDTVYVADTWNHRIQAFNHRGHFKFTFGTLPQFYGDQACGGPKTISIGYQGNLYSICGARPDSAVNSLAKTYGKVFDPDGNFLFRFSGEGNARGLLAQSPKGMDIDPVTWDVYIVDSGWSRVQRFDKDGNFLSTWGTKGTLPGQFTTPHGIAIDSQARRIYVSDTGNDNIQVFDMDGNHLASWEGVPGMVNPMGLTVDASGAVYVANEGSGLVQKFRPDGTLLLQWGGIVKPWDVSIDSVGDIYVVSTQNRVYKYRP